MERGERERLTEHIRQVRGAMRSAWAKWIESCSNATIWLYYWIYGKGFAMSTTPQRRALNNYRKRLNQRGMARYEVLGLDGDRDLIRSLAKRLASDDPDSARIRATVRRTIAGEPAKHGG